MVEWLLMFFRVIPDKHFLIWCKEVFWRKRNIQHAIFRLDRFYEMMPNKQADKAGLTSRWARLSTFIKDSKAGRAWTREDQSTNCSTFRDFNKYSLISRPREPQERVWIAKHFHFIDLDQTYWNFCTWKTFLLLLVYLSSTVFAVFFISDKGI